MNRENKRARTVAIQLCHHFYDEKWDDTKKLLSEDFKAYPAPEWRRQYVERFD